MAKKIKAEADITTEEKIKDAARKVFLQKGYAGTRTRDIAEAAGLNLALLNYYFRSKEKLFEIVMMEKMQKLFGVIAPIVMDPAMELEKKVEAIVDNYIDMLMKNQDLPIFVLSEIRNHPEKFASSMQVGSMINNSPFIQQLRERAPHIHPLHFLINIIALTVFPFIGKPIFQSANGMSSETFDQMMLERKKLIPIWVDAMLKTN
jgi:AcrR family transcriptional regulator